MPTWEQARKMEREQQLINKTILCRDNWNPGEGHFVRKGVVGDSLNYFDQQQRKDWDGWAAENLAKLGIREERVLKIFSEYKTDL